MSGKRHYRWTMHELDRLRALYAVLTWDELKIAFHPHPYKSIKTTARSLGLYRRRRWLDVVARHQPRIRFHAVVQEI